MVSSVLISAFGAFIVYYIMRFWLDCQTVFHPFEKKMAKDTNSFKNVIVDMRNVTSIFHILGERFACG